MRRLLIGSILAVGLVWAKPGHAFEQAAPFRYPRVHEVTIGEPAFDIFDRTHGLQSTQLFDVYTDPNGFIWLAGDRGIHRFDGHTFFDLDRDPNRRDTLDSRYNYLVAPSRQALWIIAPNGTVQVLDSSTGTLSRVATRGASQKDIDWLEADTRGRLWYLNPEGVIRLDRSGTATRVAPPMLGAVFSSDRQRLFAVAADQVIAIDTAGPTRTTRVLDLPEAFEGPIVRMTSDADGLWVAVDRGLWRFDLTTHSTQFIEMPFPLSLITGLVRASDGTLWFGGYDGVLYRYQPETGALSAIRNNPNDPRSLRLGSIAAITLDRSNNLWLALGGAGLARLRLNQTAPSHYRLKGGLRICSVGEIDSRRLVLGLCPGGIVEIDRKTGQQRPLPASKPLPERSRALISDRHGGLWITSLREGLIHWRPDGSTERYFLKGRENRHLFLSGIHIDGQDRVWVSHLRGLALLDREAGELRSVGGDQFYIVNDVSGGPRGTLWLGTVNGLVSFDPVSGGTRRYGHDPNDPTTLSDNDVIQAYTDKRGTLWVATRAGLNRLVGIRDGRPVFKRYGLADGLPDITISAVVNDAQGALWVGTYRGIARWDAKTDRFQSYLPADGLPSSDIYAKAVLNSADGNLYLGTWSGLWRVDPKTIHLGEPVPVVLSSYEVGDRATINLQGKALSQIRAKYSDSRVAFHIAVLGDARRLSYRLAGLENDWRDMPGDFNISFYRLPPGGYSLQIRQLQRDGSWGAPELSLPVEIMPPLWRTTWAYLLYGVIGAVLLIAMARAFMAWRHRALREQLKESHARLSVALHAARFGMWAWDVDTDVAQLDAYAKELLSVCADASPVADVFARMHPDDGERVRAQIDRALREREAVDFEFRMASDDAQGQWRWIEGHAVPYQGAGKSAYVIGVNRDATQRKHELLELEQSKQAAESALEELKRSRQDLSLALESGDLGVWRSALFPTGPGPRKWTRDVPLDCDSNVNRIFGWDTDSPTRRDFLRSVHPDDRRRVLEKLLDVHTHGGGYADQYRIVHPDGEERSVSVRAVLAQHAAPTPGQGKQLLTGIVHDVTNEEALKADLQHTAAEAQLATEAKGRFLAMMSHEIRTPINGVIGMVDLLFDSPLSEEQQQMLGICRDSAYMLLAIINDILDFSKIEAGKLKLEIAPLSPRKLVESVADALRTQVAQKDIDLDIYIAGDVPRRLLGNRVRLRQVLNNLIGNAVKFTEKGNVRIDVSVAGSSGDRPVIRFDVVDTGIGMDRATLDTLFQPFQQADEATTRRFGGTGLGLTIVKHLVALMDGRIECESTTGVGSRFSVLLPLRVTDAGQRLHPFPGLRIRALCKSRERAILLKALAADLGVAMEVESTFDRFLEVQQADAGQASQLLLIDRSHALEHSSLCRAIRRNPRTGRLPVILVRGVDPTGMVGPEPGITVAPGSPLTAATLARGIQLALGLESPAVPATATLTPKSTANGHTPAVQILLAEDNATNREVLVRQLRRLGFGCDVAEDGEQALALLQAHPRRYRMLLTDCHMPRLDGYGLTERIRQYEAATGDEHLPIVAITANALLGEGERCLALGMDGYLSKPVQIPDLQKMLARMLPPEAPPTMEGPGLANLTGLLGQREGRLQRLLDVFVKSTRSDLEYWEQARAAGDQEALRKLAHKIKSGCRQLGEDAAANALDAVEHHAGSTAEFEVLADHAQRELQRSLIRMDATAAQSRKETDLET